MDSSSPCSLILPSSIPTVTLYCIICGTPCNTQCLKDHFQAYGCHDTQCKAHGPSIVITKDLINNSSSPTDDDNAGEGSSKAAGDQDTSNQDESKNNNETAVGDKRLMTPVPKARTSGCIHGTYWSTIAPRKACVSTPQRPIAKEYDAHEIMEGLWVGSLKCMEETDFLKAKGITGVISVIAYPVLENANSPIHDIPKENRLHIPIHDTKTENIVQYFPEVIEWIDKRLRPYIYQTGLDVQTDAKEVHANMQPGQAPPQTVLQRMISDGRNKRIYVHCRAGISRSVTLVIAYLMFRRRQCFESAYAEVKQRRSRAFPNAGFREQLSLWNDTNCQLFEMPGSEKPNGKYADFLFNLELRRCQI